MRMEIKIVGNNAFAIGEALRQLSDEVMSQKIIHNECGDYSTSHGDISYDYFFTDGDDLFDVSDDDKVIDPFA